MNKEAVEQWLRVRRGLLQMEAEFTDLAIKVANGEGSEELLNQRRAALEAARQLCSQAYERAFPARIGRS